MNYKFLQNKRILITGSQGFLGKYLVERLKQARKDKGLDQKQVAVLLGVSQSYVSKVESGQRRIDVVQLKQFSKIYKKNISYFLE